MPQLPTDLQTLRGNRVVASFSPTQHLPVAAPAVPLIAADVGGTHVRVGLVRATPDQGIDVIAYRRYRCADHAGLGPILADFHAHAPGARRERGFSTHSGRACVAPCRHPSEPYMRLE